MIVGHQPHGDMPWTLSDPLNHLQVISADTGYSKNVKWFNSTESAYEILPPVDKALAPSCSTRSDKAVSQCTISFPRDNSNESEIRLRGCLGDGSSYNFVLPRPSDDRKQSFIGQQLPNSTWFVKAKLLSGDDYLISQGGENYEFRNRIISHDELRRSFSSALKQLKLDKVQDVTSAMDV